MLDMIGTDQWTVTIIGGFIFGMVVFCVRLFTLGEVTRVAYSGLVKYVIFAISAFYIVFPFPQGFMWVWDTGDADRLIEVSVTYWAFMLMSMATGGALHWLRERRR